jgi:uncharacterized protein YndB with AHSA1/START domain
VPTARATRTIATPVEDLWALVRDPHHLPRWWPRVTRVEGVEGTAFTEVMKTKKGKLVRADFDVVSVDETEHVLVWSQRIAGTPFAQVLSEAETELRLAPAQGATEVTIELRQTLVKRSPVSALGPLSFSRGVGSHMVRRAATATLKEALDGLERIGV